MYIVAVNKRFERVVQCSFVNLLSSRGYERNDNQFYLKSGRIGKLLTIQRDPELTHHGQIVIFTIRVQIMLDDIWEMNYPGQAPPVFPSQDSRYSVFARHLGQFYGKKRGTQWLALDATVPEQIMIRFLQDLLQTRILPYLDQFSSVDDILRELDQIGFSHLRMLLLARLGRKEEARLELKKLIASRHQLGFRINIVKVGQRLGLI